MKATREYTRERPNEILALEARRAVSEGRVKAFIIEGKWKVFFVESRLRDKLYFLVPGAYCSCADYFFNVFLKRRKKYCYHLLALKYALEEGKVRCEHLTLEEFKAQMFKKVVMGMFL